MSYKSPIDIFLGKIQTDVEDGAFKVIQEYGIFVDKDEMIKALKYDRGQYEKGRADGYFAAKSEIVCCRDCKHYKPQTPQGKAKYCCRSASIKVKDYDFCSYGKREK